MSSASGRSGIPLGIIKKAKRLGCPAFSHRGSVDCDALAAWCINHHAELTSSGPSENMEKALKIRAERELKELQLSELRARYVPKAELVPFLDDIKRQLTSIVRKVHLLAPMIYGQSVERIEQLLIDQEDRTLNECQALKSPPLPPGLA